MRHASGTDTPASQHFASPVDSRTEVSKVLKDCWERRFSNHLLSNLVLSLLYINRKTNRSKEIENFVKNELSSHASKQNTKKLSTIFDATSMHSFKIFALCY